MIPPSSDAYGHSDTAKVMLRNASATADEHRYLVFVDVGSDMSLSRFMDPELFEAHLAARGQMMLAEIVFQFSSPLLDGNSVTANGGPLDQVAMFMDEAPISSAEWTEISELTKGIIDHLEGQTIEGGGDTDLHRAPIGAVAHEAGSLRMGPDKVVDEDLMLRGSNNLFVCDLSVFPNSPAANPALTLAALALRLAKHIDSLV